MGVGVEVAVLQQLPQGALQHTHDTQCRLGQHGGCQTQPESGLTHTLLMLQQHNMLSVTADVHHGQPLQSFSTRPGLLLRVAHLNAHVNKIHDVQPRCFHGFLQSHISISIRGGPGPARNQEKTTCGAKQAMAA